MQLARTDGRHTRTLLALVIVMGALIVIGMAVVAVTIANRLMGHVAPAATSAGFGSAEVAVPAGCQVVETVSAADRLVLRLGTGERCNQVIIVDLATGRLLGRLNLVPAAQ
jgi:hypothetical protein